MVNRQKPTVCANTTLHLPLLHTPLPSSFSILEVFLVVFGLALVFLFCFLHFFLYSFPSHALSPLVPSSFAQRPLLLRPSPGAPTHTQNHRVPTVHSVHLSILFFYSYSLPSSFYSLFSCPYFSHPLHSFQLLDSPETRLPLFPSCLPLSQVRSFLVARIHYTQSPVSLTLSLQSLLFRSSIHPHGTSRSLLLLFYQRHSRSCLRQLHWVDSRLPGYLTFDSGFSLNFSLDFSLSLHPFPKSTESLLRLLEYCPNTVLYSHTPLVSGLVQDVEERTRPAAASPASSPGSSFPFNAPANIVASLGSRSSSTPSRERRHHNISPVFSHQPILLVSPKLSCACVHPSPPQHFYALFLLRPFPPVSSPNGGNALHAPLPPFSFLVCSLLASYEPPSFFQCLQARSSGLRCLSSVTSPASVLFVSDQTQTHALCCLRVVSYLFD